MAETAKAAFPRPVVVCSACLGFQACRYNAVTIPDPFVEKLKAEAELLPVCPEVEIGLGVPRDPIRVVLQGGRRTLFQPATGRDVTKAMSDFARRFLGELPEVDGFLLKGRSPSCGTRDVKIYHNPKPDAGSTRGPGLFGEEVLARFPGHPVEDEGRLKSFALREHFLISLYLLAELRLLARAGELSIQRLIDFHTRHKLLLMAYSQSRMRAMGRALAAYHKKNLPEVTRLYEEGLRQALAKPLSYTAMINALQHAFGGLTGDLTAEERRFFLNALEEYRDERVPLAVPLRLLEAWALRQGNGYLLSQSLLNPYPRALMEIIDSGKGRDL
jgi:uncharacterized protein YbgA (DUF1722 family)/uncharacterized protein YbbK (DUF523 family)